MKNKIVLFITGCISLVLISCLESDDYTNSIVIKDAQISSLTLSHDSIDGLSSVVFTIDQVGGNIFNKDSLPYGTEIAMVICSLQYVRSGVAAVQVTQEAKPDSTFYWNGTDSLDFSKPVKFVTTAYDGQTTKTYRAWVNIHTLVPDSMVWNLYADKMLGKTVDEQKVIHSTYQEEDVYFMYVNSSAGYQLYYSPVSDAKNWTELTLNGIVSDDLILSQITEYEDMYYIPTANGELYYSADGIEWEQQTNADFPIKSILGVIPEGRFPAIMATIVRSGDDLHFAKLEKTGEWNIGGIIPDNFPVNGFGNVAYNNMYYDYLLVVAGKDKNNQLTNKSWSTSNGLDWFMLTDKEINFFDQREGVMLTQYDEKIFLSGGINTKGEGSKEIYFSHDYGVTWQLSDTLVVFPTSYQGRGFASVFVDKDNYMLLFGGKTSNQTKPLDEIWRGRINRLGFKD